MDGPLAGLEVVALPYDHQWLLDSLGRAARTPRPRFPELEGDIPSYRRPAHPPADRAGQAWIATRDSVSALADSLRSTDRESAGYRTAYERFRQMYARLSRRASLREADLRKHFAVDLALAEKATAAADSIRTWERDAYVSYGEITRSLTERSGRQVRRVTTDASGHATLALQPGRWWLATRRPDPENPFQEHFWNIEVSVTSGLSVSVPIFSKNAIARWRY